MAEAMSDERQDANWYDDARITEAQLDAIRSDLGSTGRAQYSRAAMRKVMAEIERLQGHLNAIAVAHEEGVQARRRLDEIRDQEKAELKTRAETAERELAELRERRPLPGPTYDAGWADALRAVRMPGLHEREAAWRKFREAVGDATPQQPEPEPCDGDCDCDCQPGQPCLCPERDCYCGPCRVCGPTPQQPEGGDRG